MKHSIRTAGAVAAATGLVLSLGAFRWSGWTDTVSKHEAATATTWLHTQQQADGSFEVAGFAGFETPDAVTAIAENAQQQRTWSTAQALTAARATVKNGHSVLGAVDTFSRSGISAGQAAKLIVLVVRPLGLVASNFDPARNGNPVNLKTIVNAGKQPDGSYGAFNATLYAALAQRITGSTVAANTLAYIRAAQQPSGGWDFAADPTGNDADIDTTALAIQALAAANVALNDTTLRHGLAFLANSQRTTGAFQSFGSDDPNSTSTATMAITAAGYNPAGPCWRNQAVPALAGTTYHSPIKWLNTQQAGDGHIKSPSDSFGVNTFATSQTIEALRRGWLPVTPLAKQAC
jgi:hypothetical protein